MDYACREIQLRQLSATIDCRSPLIVVHGPRATGKSSVVRSYLEAKSVKHAIIRCRECISGRHLLERTIVTVYESLRAGHETDHHAEHTGRCENLSALTVHLQRALEAQDRFCLVFDGVIKQREAPPTLLPALARLGEFVRHSLVLRSQTWTWLTGK